MPELYLLNIFALIRRILSAIGVVIITAGCIIAIFNYFKEVLQNTSDAEYRYTQFRFTVAKATLAGLEVMVAADVINTVHDLDLYELGIILLMVTIRTILSYTLTQEILNVSKTESADQKN